MNSTPTDRPPVHAGSAPIDGLDSRPPKLAAADRVVERVHIVFACLYFALAGLATSTESIAFALVVGAAAVRAPSLWPFWARQVRSPVVVALGAWIAWTAITLAWSPDREVGRSMMKGIRGVALLFAIAPVASHWRWLVGSMLAGLSVQALCQFGQSFGLLAPHHRNDLRHPGLSSHPGHLGVFHAVAMVLAIAWIATLCHGRDGGTCPTAGGNTTGPDARGTRRRSWPWVLLLAVAIALCAAGLGITAARAAILGLLVALPVMVLAQAWAWCATRRVILGMLAAVVMAMALVVIVPISLNSAGWNMQFDQFRNLRDEGSSGGSRLVYWTAALEAWQREPILGVGAGGTHEALSTTTRVAQALERTPERDMAFFAPIHPHSMYVQTLLEGGVVGAGLLLAFLVLALRRAVGCCRGVPIGAGLLAALLVWAVAGGFDALHVAGRTASLGCALLALTWAGAGREERLPVSR